MDVRAQRHALLFRRLVDECGGLPLVMELKVTRLTRPTHLYRCLDPLSGQFAPADVIEDLELYCGKKIYTAALASSSPSANLAHDLLKETCEATVALGELMRLVTMAKAQPGGISPRLKRAILDATIALEAEVRDVVEAVEDDDRPASAGVVDLGGRRAS